MSARKILKLVLPRFAVDALRNLQNRSYRRVSPRDIFLRLRPSEAEVLIRRMDAGDYNFDPDTEKRLCEAWRQDPNSVPYPTALKLAYESQDAFAMNAKALMELTYQLPYSHAYERTQHEKYENCIDACSDVGVDFAGAHVADIGCGYGSLLEIVREKYPSAQLYGVECAASAIDYMTRRRPHITGVLADIEAPTNEFTTKVSVKLDVVLCTEVLEHLARPEHALANLLALHPSRGIAMTVPNGRIDTAAQHINFWSPELWKQFVTQNAAGWRVIVGRCSSPGSPGGFDNFAVLFPG